MGLPRSAAASALSLGVRQIRFCLPCPSRYQPEGFEVAFSFFDQMISSTLFQRSLIRAHSSQTLRGPTPDTTTPDTTPNASPLNLVPDTRGIEAPDLKTLITQGQVAALVRYTPDQPHADALVCRDMVETHRQEVVVLLWNAAIAREVTELLRHAEETRMPDDTSEALARALLDAGHGLAANSPEWPARVRDLLQKRKQANTDYWDSKVWKFRDLPVKNGLPCFNGRGAPFLSRSQQKSALNWNMKLGETGKEFACRHLVDAIQDDPKTFLKRISQRDVSFLDHAALEQRCRKARRQRSSTSVNFTPNNLGELLMRLACFVRPGELRSYVVNYFQVKEKAGLPPKEGTHGPQKDVSIGHAMRVFLDRAPRNSFGEEDPMDLKVHLYEPNVSGDMTHLRVLPVHLKKLAFGQFDTLSEAVDVLSMDVGDRALAEAWAGQFVPRTVKMQVSSFLQALSTGNLYEMRAATSVLLTMGERVPKELNGRLRELAWAVSVAASRKFAKAILEWSRSPLLKVLEPATLTEMMSVQCESFALAAQTGAVKVMDALGELFAQVEDRVEANIVRDAILSEPLLFGLKRDLQVGTGGLKRGVVEAYGGVLVRLKVKPKASDFKGVFSMESLLGLRDPPDQAIAAWDRVLQAFKPLLDHRTILDLMRALHGAQFHWEPFLRVFLRHFPTLGLSPFSLGKLLQPWGGLFHLSCAIHRKDRAALRAYAELVIAVQASPSRLEPHMARPLLQDIRGTYIEPLWYFPCVHTYTRDYKHAIQSDKALHALFQTAERALRG